MKMRLGILIKALVLAVIVSILALFNIGKGISKDLTTNIANADAPTGGSAGGCSDNEASAGGSSTY